ncbi:MAG: 30S ribosomal protein S12 methylthiotransferase RimO [Clostridia bacterium]|nr:30S ribosomal protein S12 methylthiotransferase RimO [Clostridia bacterium]
MTITEIKKKRIGFISLGCDKNRVDLEKMIFNLKSFGFAIENNPENAEIIIVNTCAFLESARAEAIENIIEMAEYKNSAKLEKLIVTGCINELGYSDLKESLPEVDDFVNIKDNEQIVNRICKLYNVNSQYHNLNDRVLTTPNHYAYIKISEGCNNFCSYCLIPYIRGRYKSTPIEDIILEANYLAQKGVKELILVAQDVTKYGIDLYGKKRLVDLIRELSKIEQISWIRLMYCYPEEIDDDLIAEIANNPKVMKYMDIPLQHVSTNILKMMNRRSDYNSICTLFRKIKNQIPNIIIRTTFILGFPGETEEDINILHNFLEEFKLYNVGFFKYSREEGTRSFNFDNQVDEKEKQLRLDKLSQVQFEIMNNLNTEFIGNVFDVIIDEAYTDYSIGRFYGQAPQIDSIIYINEKLDIGKIYKIKITNKSDYDLEGEKL